MGWSYVLTARRNHGTPKEERKELIEWRKADDIYREFKQYVPYEMYDEEVVLTKAQLKQLLMIVATTPDYWAGCNDESDEALLPNIYCHGGFSTVERLSEIYYAYNNIINEGWELVFWGG